MDLSIIILSFNTRDITDECLARLQSSVVRCQTRLKNKIEVIVLDNASTDGSIEMIEKKHSWIKLIKSRENTGFAKGNNIAINKSKNPFVLFLNSDCFVEEDTLERSLAYFKNQNCDALGIKLTYANGSFQPSAGNLPNPVNTILWIFGIANSFHPKNKVFFAKERQVGWVTGAFLMIKRQVWEKTGGFDEKIFMYMDEVDLCKRINIAGFKICFTPDIVVTHLHGASSAALPEKAFVMELAGIRYYFKKYYGNIYPLVRLFLVLGLLLRVIAFSLLGQTKRARAYVEGLGVI